MFGPHVPVSTPDNLWSCSWWVVDGVLVLLLPDLDQGISELLNSLWWYLAASDTWYITYHRCLVGFRSGECEGQSMASMPWSSRIRLHPLGTWGHALSCIRRNSGTTGVPYVGLWQCSSCSSLHKGADTDPAAGLRLCWETQLTLLLQHVWMCHPGGAWLPVQPDWIESVRNDKERVTRWRITRWRKTRGRNHGLVYSFITVC